MDVQDIKEKAHHICSDYLEGIWKTLNSDDIIIERIHGGFINYMFKLALPPGTNPIGNEPRQVLMKMFSDNLKIGQFGIMIENIIVIVLDGKKLAPNVYGIFDGGRLDEFIDSRNLQSKDLEDPKILEILIQKLAQLHCIKPPINKNPLQAYKKFEDIMEEGLISSPEERFKNNIEQRRVYERFLSLKPREEYEWLKKLRDNINSPVVFSHNDFHLNNILLRTTPNTSEDDLIRFVDYELAAYNHRGHDISRLMGCFCYDILPEPPYFKINFEKVPSEEKQKNIFKIYLNEIKIRTNSYLDVEEEIDRLLKEVKIFTIYGNFFGIIFSLFNPFQMSAAIDFSSISGISLDAYLKEKEKFLKSCEK